MLVSDLIDNFDLVCLLTAFPKQSSIIIIINNLTIFFFSVKNEFVFIVVL